MKILAFAGSNSSKSINHKLVKYIADQLSEFDIEVIKLTDFDIPMYGIDIEENDGFPPGVKALHGKIRNSDAIIISVAEHNGNITAFFKSMIDWVSRYDKEFLKNKKWVLLSTAPGKKGGASALAIAKKMLDYFKGELVGTYSLSNFKKNYISGDIIETSVKSDLEKLINSLIKND